MAAVKPKRSGSPFDPPPQFSGMEFLYPSSADYRKSEMIRIVFGGGLAIAVLVLTVVLLFQLRLPPDKRFLDPLPVIFGFTALAIFIKYLISSGIKPVNLFFDPEPGKLIFVTKKFFGSDRLDINVSDIDRVELNAVTANEKTGRQFWGINVRMKDGTVHSVPPVQYRIYALQGAMKVARKAKMEVVTVDADGKEVTGEEAEVFGKPLYKRLNNPKKPERLTDDLLIKKENISGGTSYEIGLPFWISLAVVAFAGLNLVLGLYIWFTLPKEMARFASIPFLVTTFVVFIFGALVNSYRRNLEVTMKGVSHHGILIPLHRLEDIHLVTGAITRLQFVSREDMFSLIVTLKQAEWLKNEIGKYLYTRRKDID